MKKMQSVVNWNETWLPVVGYDECSKSLLTGFMWKEEGQTVVNCCNSIHCGHIYPMLKLGELCCCQNRPGKLG